ncbi:Cytochrome P450 monooxygenase [Pseudocercospora fuligena]|uniref:Cytochrome P450 monooxygenase n=1 Tax=Pseudocercospora fuligena TaxID=685502 RepID=A0A8H6RM27_9PEZI|nr:Cytochrome P450 monooxygenase [Pseudocercospora fuligena]
MAATSHWPDGARAAIALTLDNMGEAAELNRGLWPDSQPVGSHHSVIEALPKILDLLKKYDIKVTYFIESWNLDRYPSAIADVVAGAGHEVGWHAYQHEAWYQLDAAAERDNFKRSFDALYEFIAPGSPGEGKVSLYKGFRPPGGPVHQPRTLELCHEHGLRYISAAAEHAALVPVTAQDKFAVLPYKWRNVDAYYYMDTFGRLRLLKGETDGKSIDEHEMVRRWKADIDHAIERGEFLSMLFHPFLTTSEERLNAIEEIASFLAQKRDEGWPDVATSLTMFIGILIDDILERCHSVNFIFNMDMPTKIALIFGTTALVVYFLYRSLLPRPIPGIPYNKDAANSVLGDLPAVLQYQKETGEVFRLFQDFHRRLKSPIIQVFTKPGGRPWVIVADSQEAYDIMSRRSTEFDRSKHFGDLFRAYTPYFTVGLPTNELWRHQRRLVSDTMAPSFIANTNAPAIYSAFAGLVALWRAKVKVAGHLSIDVEADIDLATLDAICAAAFGESPGCIKAQTKVVTQVPPLANEQRLEPVRFPTAAIPPGVQAIPDLEASAEIVTTSPLGWWHHKLDVLTQPRLRRAMREKYKLCRGQINLAAERLKDVKDDNSSQIKSAADLVVSRAIRAAKKAGEVVNLHNPAVYDELYGYLIGGHGTVTTTVSWGICFLQRNTAMQQRLRSALHEAFPKIAHGESPSADDIAAASIPYLDAFVEETMRLSNTAAANIRVTNCDARVLGCIVPKGTDVFLLQPGSIVDGPEISCDDELRSKTSKDSSSQFGKFDPDTVARFMPERWLREKDDGNFVFDQFAGHQHGFGAGPRGCFGKRLAHLQLRIFFTLIVWNFELLHTNAPLRGKQILIRKPQELLVKLKAL